MPKLIKNANAYVEKSLKEKSTVAYYLALKEAVERKHETVFAAHMQSYVTRLGLIVANCYQEKLNYNTFLGSIEYLCKHLFKNNNLYNLLRAIGVNDGANDGKHSLHNVDVYIKECVHQYNNLINAIIDYTKLNAFKKCYLKITAKKNQRDIPLGKDKQHHKYCTCAGIKFQIKLCDDYTFDQYSKELCSKITLFWPEANEDILADIDVINTKTNKHVVMCQNISMSHSEDKKALNFRIKEESLDRRVLNAKIKITFFKNISHTYKTGFIFKKVHEDIERKEIGVFKDDISQFYRPEHKK